jgi:predicted RND superfamily exporter protein
VREGTPPEVLDAIEAATDSIPLGEASTTGLYVRAVHTTRSLVGDLFRGVVLMIAVVVLVTVVAFRSWRLGLAAILPNLLPPAAVFGAAALLHTALDVSAIAVGAVAVGLAIDNTFHVMDGVVRAHRDGRSLPRALEHTQRTVGRALVVSTAVLTAGLLCLRASAFLPTAQFGTLASASCLVALFGDLILLPAALLFVRRL